MSSRSVVIFDIDGTLVRPGSRLQTRHMAAMDNAIEDVSGCPARIVVAEGESYFGGVSLNGFTDAGTIALSLQQSGHDEESRARLLPLVIDRMVTFLGPPPERCRGRPAPRGRQRWRRLSSSRVSGSA